MFTLLLLWGAGFAKPMNTTLGKPDGLNVYRVGEQPTCPTCTMIHELNRSAEVVPLENLDDKRCKNYDVNGNCIEGAQVLTQ